MLQMKITNPDKCDEPVLKKMWKNIFKDSDSYIELFFSVKYKSENTFVVKENDEVVSMLFVEYNDIVINDKIYKGAYFCGIATDEKCRGKGYAGKLIEYAKSHIDKVDIIYLIPANKSLFDFYDKFGFKIFTYLDKITLTADGGISSGEYSEAFDYEKVNEFYENSGNGLYVKRNREYFDAIVKCYENIMVFSDGYVIYYIDKEVLHLVEYSFSYEQAVEAAKGIMNMKGINEAVLYKKWGGTPFSVCITDIDIENADNRYINLMLN